MKVLDNKDAYDIIGYALEWANPTAYSFDAKGIATLAVDVNWELSDLWTLVNFWSTEDLYQEAQFAAVMQTADGFYIYIEGGSDCRWDCQAGSTALISKSLDRIYRLACTKEDREKFGIDLKEAK